MANSRSCYYDCEQPPDTLTPYPDITGTGVLVGYTATAGTVVVILVLHYYLAHDPTKDPFRKESASGARVVSLDSRPNPIDVIYLGCSSKVLEWLRSSLHLPKAKAHPRLEAAFVKCVQSMSDLQILTGISILVSGYVQLRCGLSAFHWQIIVLLAWFSSITHLSCLTFLRNHLYNRPAERLWRLIAMGLMLAMLSVAMVPTGGYDWSWTPYSGYHNSVVYLHPLPSDYAICYLQTTGEEDPMAFSTMVVSITFLVLGFVYRVIRLHKVLSVSIFGSLRAVLSRTSRWLVRQVYNKLSIKTSGSTLKRALIYRPVLALFLTFRILLDFWNSMFVKIFWMVGSFVWGLIRLQGVLGIDSSYNDWSFGQVIPIVLLAAPLLTIFESFFQTDQPSSTISTALTQIHISYLRFNHDDYASSDTPLHERDHPDRDFYHDSSWITLLIYTMVSNLISIAAVILLFGYNDQIKLVKLLVPSPVVPLYLPFYIPLNIWLFVLPCMLLEDLSYTKRQDLRFFVFMTQKNFIAWCKGILFCLVVGSGIVRIILDLYVHIA